MLIVYELGYEVRLEVALETV